MTHWKIHVLYLGDITIPKAMGTMGLDMNLVLPGPLSGLPYWSRFQENFGGYGYSFPFYRGWKGLGRGPGQGWRILSSVKP